MYGIALFCKKTVQSADSHLFTIQRSPLGAQRVSFAVHGWLYPNGFCHERNPPWNALATEEDSYLGC